MRRPNRRRLPSCRLVVCASATVLAASCAFTPPLPAPTDPRPSGAEGDWRVQRIEEGPIRESSGLARSRQRDGVFWTHNDSGDAPRLFAISRQGAILAEVAVVGAKHRDWEDIAIDEAGRLYIADVGNNLNRRHDLVVYRVDEPSLEGPPSEVEVEAKYHFHYAAQNAYPDWSDLSFDAEAVFWMEGALYLFTKHRSDDWTCVYRLELIETRESQALKALGCFDLEKGGALAPESADRGFAIRARGNVTAADLHASGEWLALLTYRALHLLRRSHDDSPFPFQLDRRITLATRRTRQVESVVWDGDDLLFGNEEGRLFRIPAALTSGIASYPP